MRSYTTKAVALNFSNAYPGGTLNSFNTKVLTVRAQGVGNGVDPVPQSYDVRVIKPLFCDFIATNGPYRGTYSRNYQGIFAWPGDSISGGGVGLENSALSNLTDSVRGNLDLSVDIAEAGKTLSMAENIRHFMFYAASFKRELKTNAIKAVGSKWLEYKYGWQPLLSSIYETGKKICSPDPGDHDLVLHARAHNSQTWRTPNWTGLISIDGIAHDTTRIEYGITLRPKPNRLTSLGGYTSLNPLAIAWELMPYSFVIDWFIDVGGYMRNAETALLYRNQFVRGYKTVTQRRHHEYWANSFWRSGNSDWVCTTQKAFQTLTKKDRTVLGSYPIPRYPVLEPHLGSSRLFSAASLLSQFLDVKPRVFDERALKPLKLRSL